ncbi:MAG: PH domain-containing protein [Candidatus Saccharimonadales bacterium]
MSEDKSELQPSSHVKNAPDTMPGHNYDPQIRTQHANEPKVVHAARNPEAAGLHVSDDNKQRHEKSMRRYPHLNLSEGEFVVLDVKRHPIGLFLPALATMVALLAITAVLIIYPSDVSSGMSTSLPSYENVLVVMVLLMILVMTGGAIAVWVYLQNQFYMTNESVIQEIQHGLFSRHEQTVSLGSIEDASFKQSGLLQSMLNYGTVRLSTEGEETTYSFSFVQNPRRHIAILNNAVEAFKNGRPVDPYET